MNKKSAISYDAKNNSLYSKKDKGITLIALIITIVILLILAVVTITAIENDGILGYSQNAGEKYNAAGKSEKEVLNEYEKHLNEGSSSTEEHTWKYINTFSEDMFNTFREYGAGDYQAYCEVCGATCTHPQGITQYVKQIRPYGGFHYIVYECPICGVHEIMQICEEAYRCTICAYNWDYEPDGGNLSMSGEY